MARRPLTRAQIDGYLQERLRLALADRDKVLTRLDAIDVARQILRGGNLPETPEEHADPDVCRAVNCNCQRETA